MVLLTDQLGKTRAGIATDVVGLSDETGTPRAALGIAGLQLKDKDGKEIRVSTTALGGPTAERWFIWVKSVYLLIGSPRRVEWYQHATVYQSPTESAADLAKVQPDFAKRNSDTKRLIDVYGYCFPHAVNPMAQTGATP